MSRILIVDDEPGIRQSLKGVFDDEGFSTDVVSSGEECLKKIRETAYDLVLLDIWLPGIDGIETLRRLREISPVTRVIMISGHATIATAVTATKLGAYDFIEKPLSLDHTLLIARNALSHSRLEQTNDHVAGINWRRDSTSSATVSPSRPCANRLPLSHLPTAGS